LLFIKNCIIIYTVRKKLTKILQKSIEKKLLAYIESTEIPIIAEFAYINDIRRTSLYEHPYLRDTLKRAIDKKEAQLERKALNNEINTTMAIFSLKQLGWKDKHDISADLSGKIEIKVNIV